jgi:hypothetical protein
MQFLLGFEAPGVDPGLSESRPAARRRQEAVEVE